MSKNRIDIAISEKGASAVVQAINRLADASQKLSPALAASLRGRALRVGVSTDKVVEDVAVKVLEEVVKRTPHDTGQARANWQTAVRVSRPINTPKLGVTDYDGDATIAEGTAIIRGTPRPPGHVIYISNSLDYIEALENGWSKQAPHGMAKLAVQAGSQVARNAKILK